MILRFTFIGIILVPCAYGNINSLFKKYDEEERSVEGYGSVTSKMVTAVIQQFNTKLVIILFDDFYAKSINFKWILDNVLIGIEDKTVKFGLRSRALERIHANEQPGFVIFSLDPERLPGTWKTFLICYTPVFRLKEWLSSSIINWKYQLIAAVDPSLKLNGVKATKDYDIGLYRAGMESPGSAAFLVTAWRMDHFTRPQVPFFWDWLRKGYGGRRFVAAASYHPPFVYKRVNPGGSHTWEGIEVRLLNQLAEALNFTVELREFKSGITPDLKADRALIGVGGIFSTISLHKHYHLTYPHIHDCAAFLSMASLALSKYRAITGPFLWDVWIALICVYILAILPIAFSVWHSLRPLLDHPAEIENMFWYVFGTFTNLFTFTGKTSWTVRMKSATKLFISTYWVFTIIITACYTGSIIAFITIPVYPEVVDSLHQLLHKNYRVITLDTDLWWEVLTSAEDDDASGLGGTASRVSTSTAGLSQVIQSQAEDRPAAFLGSQELLAYLIKTNYTIVGPNSRRLFHISRQCLVPLQVSFLLPHNSVYSSTFDLTLLRAVQSGLLHKIISDFEWTTYRSSLRSLLAKGQMIRPVERQLTLDDTQGMFLLLAIGFALSMIAFTFEVCTWLTQVEQGLVGREVRGRVRSMSQYVLAPLPSYFRQHYPLYFSNPNTRRRGSSLFGSYVLSRWIQPSLSEINLKRTEEKPVRHLSF